MDERPSIGILIPTLNGGERFADCLAGIGRQRRKPDQVLVIDSSSTDGTAERAARWGATVMRIPKREFHHGLTRDRGIALLKTPWVVLLVQDAEPIGEDWLESLTAPLADPRVAGVCARQLPRDDLPPLLRDRLLDWGAGQERPRVQTLPPWDLFLSWPARDREAAIVFDNVCSAIRRDVWESFPFGRRAFGEDLDWAVRVLRAGYRLVYQPQSRVLHSHHNGLWYEFKRVYLDHQNRRRLLGTNPFPRLIEVPVAAWNAWKRHRRSIPPSAPLEERLGQSAWAGLYFLSQNLAQYLGATLQKRVDQNKFARLDSWMRRGV